MEKCSKHDLYQQIKEASAASRAPRHENTADPMKASSASLCACRVWDTFGCKGAYELRFLSRFGQCDYVFWGE